MKKIVLLLTTILLAGLTTTALTPATVKKDYKFGKVTKAELLRTDFPDIVDGAKMVVLDEHIEANLRNSREWYQPISFTFGKTVYIRTIELFDTKKIKIIEPAISCDTKISFTLANNEILIFKQIKATHYSPRNNRIVKRHYSIKDIKQTVLPDKSTRYSFNIPDAVAGDVFEFTYSKRMDLTDAEFYDLTLQQDIPVLDIRCDLATPRRDDDFDKLNDFYKTIFRIGKYRISEQTSTEMRPYTQHVKLYNTDARLRNNKYDVVLSDIFIYEAANLPAITDESDGEIAKIRVIFNGDSPE